MSILSTRSVRGQDLLINIARELYAYSESVGQNLLRKIREFSDVFYPWGVVR